MAKDGPRLARFFDPSMLAACAALQLGPEQEPATSHLVKKTLRRLRRAEPTAETQAMAAQLEAALRLRARDVDGALQKLGIAAERYATAGMALHEALIQWRIGRLRGGPEGERSVAQARALHERPGDREA